MLVNLKSLLNSTFISFTNNNAFFNLLHFFFSLYFKLFIIICYYRYSLINAAHLVIFVFSHMFIHALHTHDNTLLLTKKHQRLFMLMAFNLNIALGELLPLPAFTTFSLRIDASLTTSIGCVRCFSLFVNIWSSLSIWHFSQFRLTETCFICLIMSWLL